ncbi:Vacuolar protein sorting-associated protein [Trema orientale]|uniref:Vacuolar protein sorting-associated protein n=1 Tax=Trema orientale TaxID=63057 RepID=A0A2P5ELP9_TREOI|nr:Vacuolar protein sorting-associated protein [Trema orientale]
MLDGLLKPKFYSKCKTNVKLTKTRLEAIKKKRNAVQKFLKNDIADLLRNGLDSNSYSRAEGFLVEQNLTASYELVENFCGCILSNLSLMQKQRECPEECKEAVSSLIYAAARFADLPELRDLRNLFTERYGNSLESYISKEFMERLKPKPFSKEMKLQLLQDIAREFSIEWDSKALEQKLYTPPPALKQPEYASLTDNGDERRRSNKREEDALPRRNTEESGNKMSNLSDHTASEGKSHRGRVQSSSEDETFTDFSQDERKTSSSSAGSVSEDDADSKRPFYQRLARPPYLKPKPDQSGLDVPTKLNSHVDQVVQSNLQENQVVEDKPKPRSVRRRNLKPPPGYESSSKQEPRPGLRTINANDSDPRDEEEKMIDGLLMHFSNKRSPYESNRSKKPELALPPGRLSSLPPEPLSPAVATRAPARAASLEPEILSTAGHVHPKLPPDYDEFAARIAALRGK